MYAHIAVLACVGVFSSAGAWATAERGGESGGPLAEEAAERTPPEIAARNVLFEELDARGDGFITRGEAQALPELHDQFDQLDTDGDGRISRQEFAQFETELIVPPEPAPEPAAGREPAAVRAPSVEQQRHAEPAQPGAPAAETEPGLATLPRPGERPLEEPAPNVLILRAEVAAMAYETVEAVETHTMIPMAEPVGWAVFSGVPLGEELAPGTGMARHERGEEYYLFMRGLPPLEQDQRFVLTFDHEGLFRDFRQGQVDGPALERARARGLMEAYQITVDDGLQVQPVSVGEFAFELDGELERALIGVPSVTGDFIDPADPWVHDN